MTIGELLDALQPIARRHPRAVVYFDFAHCLPTTIDSWRGSYDQAALGWSKDEWDAKLGCAVEPPTVSELVARIEAAIAPDKTFQGYKGGDYRYTRTTEIHIDNCGRCTGTELVAVRAELLSDDGTGWVYLHTRREGEQS